MSIPGPTSALRPPSPAARSATGQVRVASVPAGHVYVRHLEPVGGDPSVIRLPDPDPDHPDRAAGERWWPPVALTPDWVEANHDRFDVFHLHFGFDAIDPAELRETVAALRRHGRPLVYTVHDLRNPHHRHSSAHDAHLDVLIPGADALVTLTPGAADAIARRWGRRPRVLPHPHVVDLPTMSRLQAAPRRRSDERRLGVHVKSGRANLDPLPVLRTIVAELDQLPGAVLQVNGHRDLLEPGGPRHDPELAVTLTTWAGLGRIELRVHDFLTDDELWDYLSSLHASVLPYRFGTHSGWLEACRDLGTAVLAPTCGYYADQGPTMGYRHDENGLDAESLVSALHTWHAASSPTPAPVTERAAQRAEIARAHAALYRSLL